jgi:cell division protein FtsB
MKFFAAALVIVVALLQYRLWVSDGGVRSVVNLRKAVAAQRTENESLTRRNQQLAAEVKDLKEGTAALEERARNDLGMIGSAETFYQVAEPGAPGLPNTEPAPARSEGVADSKSP